MKASMFLSPQARGWSLSSCSVGVAVPEDFINVGVTLVPITVGEMEAGLGDDFVSTDLIASRGVDLAEVLSEVRDSVCTGGSRDEGGWKGARVGTGGRS